MPSWLLPFLGARAAHFVIYGVLALIIWGLYTKIFGDTTSTNIGKIERQVNVYHGEGREIIPILGCAAWRVNAKIYYQRPVQNQSKENKNVIPTNSNRGWLRTFMARWW